MKLAQPADESKSKTLLDPELNPIMNPLLAAHMGRWAEVYFTTPPEKREEAVAALVRQLANDAEAGKAASRSAESRPAPVERNSAAFENQSLGRNIETPQSEEQWLAPKELAPIQQRAALEQAEARRSEIARVSEIEALKIEAFATQAPAVKDADARWYSSPGREEILDLRETDREADEILTAQGHTASPLPSNPTAFAEEEPQVAVCESCGHLNVGGQRFCGMCGSTLPVSATSLPADSLPEPAPANSSALWDEDDDDTLFIPEVKTGSRNTHTEIEGKTYEDAAPMPEANAYSEREFSGRNEEAIPRAEFERQQEAEVEDEVAPPRDEAAVFSSYGQEPVRRNYRLYIGLVVVAILGVLVYVTWRNNAGNGFSSSALPRAIPSSPVTSSPVPTSAAPDSSAPPKSPIEAPPAVSPKRSAVPAASNHEVSKQEQRATPAASIGDTHIPPDGHSSQSPDSAQPATALSAESAGAATEQAGAEELAAAEKDLQAGPLGASQAVPLLWKAVAKQNARAALLLSDLYLRGEGVAKSCDQARLLLNAAARKTGAAAADRLKKLQDSGCQ